MKQISANFMYISFRYLSKYECRLTAKTFPFSICYDVIVMCIRDVMLNLLAFNFSFYGPTLDFCSTYIINSVLLANYITDFGRNSLVLAETAVFRPKALHFGRNKTISAQYSVSAEFRFF